MRRAREIILAADDRVTESIKWKTPTFAYEGNIASFNPAKNVVSLLFHRGAEIPGEPPASKATASSSAPCASPTSTSSRPGRPTSSPSVAPGATGRRTGRDAPEEPRLEPSARGAQAASAAALADDAFPGGRDPWNPFRREERAAVDLADGAAAGLDDGVGPDDLQVQQQSGTTGYRTQAAA